MPICQFRQPDGVTFGYLELLELLALLEFFELLGLLESIEFEPNKPNKLNKPVFLSVFSASLREHEIC
jgi:hypothetical protein